MSDETRPTLGLRPRSVVDMERCAEIAAAMHRYFGGGLLPPGEWIGELLEKYNALKKGKEEPQGGTKRR